MSLVILDSYRDQVHGMFNGKWFIAKVSEHKVTELSLSKDDKPAWRQNLQVDYYHGGTINSLGQELVLALEGRKP